MEWTEEQEDIIEARDVEMLVSAAAGSGKTAVLVERIYHRVMDEDEPVDIDRFVVVTFTNAAAAEMKERLRKRMEGALQTEELSAEQRTRLRRQIRLVPGAHISTVHSFCSFVIGQYFHRIGIDPGLKTGSEAELKLLRHEVAEQLLALEYEEEQEDFLRLAELFSLNKRDDMLEDWILQLHEIRMSEPFPDRLTAEWKRLLTTPVEDADSPYIDMMLEEIVSMCRSLRETSRNLVNVYSDLEEKYYRTIRMIDAAVAEIVRIGDALEAGETGRNEAYEAVRLVLMGLEFKGGLPKTTTKEELKDVCHEVHPPREFLEKQRDEMFIPFAELENERERMTETCLPILRLATRFGEMYAEAKRERGLLDFNDLEQFALRILYEPDENGDYVRSEAARELSEGFEEIMIDEYQDSNRVQDTILWSVARSDEPDGPTPPWERTATNRFMVGDIKQSIYRFRHACPELFESKLKQAVTYEPGKPWLYCLSKNFRSAKIIVDATNTVFDEVMYEDIGGIRYDDNQELEFGAILPEEKPDMPIADCVEVDELDYGDSAEDKTIAEAVHTALRIRDMVEGKHPLAIRDGKIYRRVRYRDIVILSRAVLPIAGVYAEVFRQAGVPFFTTQKEGFYGAREVRLMLEFLTVIDNPRQDIPLAGVLTGPMFDITEEELSLIRIATADYRGDLYGRLELVCGDEFDGELPEELKARVRAFFKLLHELREAAPLSTVSSLVETIFRETEIYEWFAAQPDGERRTTNLDYFLHIVTEYDRGSYKGVHAFIDYIGRVIRRNEDMGEPVEIGETEDVVRMMSVHKSKGLEFPVVFLVRMDSDGNRSGSGRFISDSDLGLAGYIDNLENGIYKKPVIYKLLEKKDTRDDLGERLRLLYVAMTRAKDQLILVREYLKERPEPLTDYVYRTKMTSFTSMVEPAVRYAPGDLFRLKTSRVEKEWKIFRKLAGHEDTSEKCDGGDIPALSSGSDEAIRALLEAPACQEQREEALPVKLSVSELKKAAYEDELAEQMYAGDTAEVREAAPEPEVTTDDEVGDEEFLPRFMREDEAVSLSGAARGTIYHQVMATLKLDRMYGLTGDDELRSALREDMDRLVRDRCIFLNEKEVINEEKILRFLTSSLGQRMIGAAHEHRLHREQPFLLNKPAQEIAQYAEHGDTPIMIQGIIDAFFETEDGLVLMDYKTDRIRPGEEESLVRRYRIQLELYRDALETVWQKPVKECLLYSFSLDSEVPVSL